MGGGVREDVAAHVMVELRAGGDELFTYPMMPYVL